MGSPSAHDGTRSSSSAPRAVIHKRILDVAEAQPNASMERIAGEVSGASVDLVEQVLEEYGDPASASSDAGETADGSERTAEAGTAADAATGSTENEDAQESTDSTDETDESSRESDVASEESDEPSQDADAVTEASDDPAEGVDESDDSGVTDESAAADESSDGEPMANGGESDAGDDASERTGAAVSRESIPSDDAGSDDAGPVTDPAELTPKQRETFRLIYERPDAPQQEIADALGVTRATVSRRVNDADGFDWDNRRAFVARLFDGEPDQSPDGGAAPRAGRLVTGRTASSDGGPNRASDERGGAEPIRSPAANADDPGADEEALADAIDGLTERVARLEDAVGGESSGGDCGALADPDLAHKVVHACMDAEYVTEEEELRVLRSILDD